VGHELLLPAGSEPQGDKLIFIADLPTGRLFKAGRPGVSQVECMEADWALTVRIAPHRYVGPLKHRYREDAVTHEQYNPTTY
jgi:hypothetical protein